MSTSAKVPIPLTMPDSPRIWYPLPPRWMPLLRIAGVVCAGYALYGIFHERSWSVQVLQHAFPVLLALYWLGVKPELRKQTLLNRLGRTAHHWLVFIILPITLLRIIDWIIA